MEEQPSDAPTLLRYGLSALSRMLPAGTSKETLLEALLCADLRAFEYGIWAVGVAVCPWHMKGASTWSVWKSVARASSIKIILLRPEDTIRWYARRVRHVRGQVYQAAGRNQVVPQAVPVRAMECARQVRAIEKIQVQLHRMFAGHDVMSLSYEELTGNTVKALARVQGFLGIPQEMIHKPVMAPKALPLSDLILGWEKLRAELCEFGILPREDGTDLS